jgi:hypothetical protein
MIASRPLLFLTVITATVLLSGCSYPRAYEGPALSNQQVASLKGYSTVCYGSLQVQDFDGTYSGFRLQIIPGVHEMNIQYWGEPFFPDNVADLSPFAVCIYRAKFRVKFESRAERTYTFDVKDYAPDGPTLTVWESNSPKTLDSHQIPAQVERQSLARQCTLSSYYEECFDY